MSSRFVMVFLAMSVSSTAYADVSDHRSNLADPDARGVLALVIDPRGVDVCDETLCSRRVRVLGVIQNHTKLAAPTELTILREPKAPPITGTFVILRRLSGGIDGTLWLVLPANEPARGYYPIRALASF
jgi:hypothetical protein